MSMCEGARWIIFGRQESWDPECNVQFGEGGAGTFSDGKLNTMVKDPSGRNRKVLECFVAHGAPGRDFVYAETAYRNR